jgi:hypothetical protein
MELKIIWQYILTGLSGEKLLLAQCMAFFILNILDGISTWLVLKPDHYERERNPIARWVFRKLKLPYAIIFFKALLLSFMGVFIAYNWKEALTINTGLLFGNLLFIFVVRHNFRVHNRYLQYERQLEKILYYKVISE